MNYIVFFFCLYFLFLVIFFFFFFEFYFFEYFYKCENTKKKKLLEKFFKTPKPGAHTTLPIVVVVVFLFLCVFVCEWVWVRDGGWHAGDVKHLIILLRHNTGRLVALRDKQDFSNKKILKYILSIINFLVQSIWRLHPVCVCKWVCVFFFFSQECLRFDE